MLDKGQKRENILKQLTNYHNQDMLYESGKILGSMCTKPDPIAVEAYEMFLETNLGDPGLFQGTALMEKEVINSLGELLHLPNAYGHIVTGGTEANIMAITAAKYLKEDELKGTPEIILPKSAHFSFKKICHMLSLKPKYVPLTSDYKIDTNKIEELISENTIAMLAIAGTTELGLIDDIEKISDIAYNNQIYLHVDAALGGFMIPFINYKNNHQVKFDFQCKGVSSMTIDPHKMGLAPIPAGGIIFREKKSIEQLAVKTPYLTRDEQTTIVGTRTGASTAATWALLNYYGKEGYKEIVERTIDTTRYTYNLLKQIDDIKIVHKPELNLISFTSKTIDVDSLQKELFEYGWQVSQAEYPHAIRIVLMPHVKIKHIDQFIKDLKNIINSKK
jgi:tyrosine decarboxylase/aspartate 1-decarboxylase